MWKILFIVVILFLLGYLTTWGWGYGPIELLGPTTILLTLMMLGYIPRSC